jgi:hypothetical protein
MVDNTQILWGDTKIMIIDHTPQKKIDKAKRFVDQCVSGERGFCFRLVKRYPLADGGGVRLKIKELKAERMNAATTKERGDVITGGLKNLRVMEREYYTYDQRAYRTLRSNYDKLKRLLAFLHREGEIESYSLSGFGEMTIQWFRVQDSLVIDVVEQGDTYSYEHTPPSGHDNSLWISMGLDEPFTECIPIRVPSELVEQGKVAKEHEGFGKNRGNGEYDGDIMVNPFKKHHEPTPAEKWDIRKFNNDNVDTDVPRFT